MAQVQIHGGEALESALLRFKREVQQEDIVREIRRHSFDPKTGEKKHAKETWPASSPSKN
jgi:small subunit ribosomal protein S21